MWQMATPAEYHHLFVEEVHRQEETSKCANAISKANQGSWTRWDAIERRKISWSEVLSMESNMLSLFIRATYDVLPSLTNLILGWERTHHVLCVQLWQP